MLAEQDLTADARYGALALEQRVAAIVRGEQQEARRWLGFECARVRLDSPRHGGRFRLGRALWLALRGGRESRFAGPAVPLLGFRPRPRRLGHPLDDLLRVVERLSASGRGLPFVPAPLRLAGFGHR